MLITAKVILWGSKPVSWVDNKEVESGAFNQGTAISCRKRADLPVFAIRIRVRIPQKWKNGSFQNVAGERVRNGKVFHSS